MQYLRILLILGHALLLILLIDTVGFGDRIRLSLNRDSSVFVYAALVAWFALNIFYVVSTRSGDQIIKRIKWCIKMWKDSSTSVQ